MQLKYRVQSIQHVPHHTEVILEGTRVMAQVNRVEVVMTRDRHSSLVMRFIAAEVEEAKKKFQVGSEQTVTV